MECSEARAAEDDDDGMVSFELEAAEALAGLCRCSYDGEAVPASSSHASQDPAIAAQQCCRCTSNTVSSPGKCEKTVHTAGFKSNPAGKLKQISKEAEKEARKLRRILANRESARQTIRRRQAMHLELTRKAADLSEENENLKKEKELAMLQYNFLKDRNKYLKAKMVKIKKAERGDAHGEPNSTPGIETSTPATMNSPMFICNQPSLVPCFWSSILPSSEVFQFRYASHPDVMGSSQFVVPHRETSHQGQANSMGPMFVLPVPWMLPLLTQTSLFHTNDRQNETSTTQQCSNNTFSTSNTPSDHKLRNEASESRRNMPFGSVNGGQFTFPPESSDLHTGCYTGSPSIHADASISAADEHITRSLFNKNRDPLMCPRKADDVLAATEARRRRKELMSMKNIRCLKMNT